jgi:hypothetical protein
VTHPLMRITIFLCITEQAVSSQNPQHAEACESMFGYKLGSPDFCSLMFLVVVLLCCSFQRDRFLTGNAKRACWQHFEVVTAKMIASVSLVD